MEVVNVYQNGDRLVLLRRDEQGELRQSYVRAEHSLFVRTSDWQRCTELKSSRAIKKVQIEGDFVRIVCRDRDVRDKLVNGRSHHEPGWFRRRGIEVFEADLNPVKRWLIDSGAKVQKPRAVYLDFEWDSRVPFARKHEARFLCWGLTFENGDRVGGILEDDTDEAERELLKDLFFELAYADQVLAWNGERADFEMIKARLERLQMKVDLRRWLWLDHMQLFAKFNMTASDSGDEKASLALDRVAESLGVRGKIENDWSVPGAQSVDGKFSKNTWALWAAGGEHRRRLGLYCVEDSTTCHRIESVTGYVAILATLAETCGVLPNTSGMRGVNFVESYLLRLGAKRGTRAPTRYDSGGFGDGEKFKGAFVFPTKKRGLIRDVHVCDFTRLYPSIIQSWNMSPETWIPRELDERGKPKNKPKTLEEACKDRPSDVAVCPNTYERFRLGARGLFAEALDDVTQQRAYWSKYKTTLEPGSPEWKEADRKDAAFKIIANTFYGVSGSPFSRFFLRELSESVTQIGVWLIQNTVLNGERNFGLFAVAGDTDSGFFQGCTEDEFANFVQNCNEVLYPGLIAPTGADAKRISLAFEKSFSLMINVEKKTYAGRLSHFKRKVAKDDTKPMIKGLEYKRGDTARLARKLQQEIVETLLCIGKPLPENYEIGPAELERILERWQGYVLGAKFPYADVVISKSMSKPLDAYGKPDAKGKPGAIPAHVRIAKILADRGEAIYEGAKVEYVVIDGSKSPQVVAPAIDTKIEQLDLYHLWESVVFPAAQRVLEACFPDHLWKRWGAVRPLKGVHPKQIGFGFGERKVIILD